MPENCQTGRDTLFLSIGFCYIIIHRVNMLKNKERRDTFLLVSMGLVMVIFILYLVVPLGKTKQAPGEPEPGKSANLSEKPVEVPHFFKTGDYFSLFSQKIESELDRISQIILDSEFPFEDYPVDNLEAIFALEKIDEKTRLSHPQFFTQLKKCLMIGFYDLKDLFQFEFPEHVSARLKFNIFVSLFLLKLKSENVQEEIPEFPEVLFRKVVNCIPYLAIHNEIDRDYQALPVLFYFRALANRMDIFPTTDMAGFFMTRIHDIRDLSPGKWITGIAEMIGFSRDPLPYRISWKEADDLNPDDTGVYANLRLKTFGFLRQVYLVFPDFRMPANNTWIKELCEADSGDIELTELQICSEDASKNMCVEKIYYTPGKSQFIVLLRPYDYSGRENPLCRIVFSRLEAFLQNFMVIDFKSRYGDTEAFKDAMLQFGHYLKSQVYPTVK
jgi:hypothetical protein